TCSALASRLRNEQMLIGHVVKNSAIGAVIPQDGFHQPRGPLPKRRTGLARPIPAKRRSVREDLRRLHRILQRSKNGNDVTCCSRRALGKLVRVRPRLMTYGDEYQSALRSLVTDSDPARTRRS